MSHLVVASYPDTPTALEVREKLFELQKQNLIKLEDVAVVEKRLDGRIKLHQVTSTTGRGALWGSVWGGLLGMLFFAPLLGMAVGAAAGAAGGSMTDLGVDDSFMRDLAEQLQPGTAAVFALIDQATQDKVLAELAPYGSKIIHTSLSGDAEERLREAAKAAQAAAQRS